MEFKGMCIAVEDTSYTSKSSGRVEQTTLTCVDADTKARLKGMRLTNPTYHFAAEFAEVGG